MRPLLTSAILAVLALAACSPKPAAPASNEAAANTASAAPATPATPSAATPTAAGPITADQLPAPRAGLWERTSVQEGQAEAMTARKCMDGKPVNPLADGPPCAKVEMSRTAAGGFVIDADCPNNGIGAKMHMTAEGDFNTAYTTEGVMTMSQAGQPDMVLRNHSTYRYIGACPAGGAPQG